MCLVGKLHRLSNQLSLEGLKVLLSLMQIILERLADLVMLLSKLIPFPLVLYKEYILQLSCMLIPLFP